MGDRGQNKGDVTITRAYYNIWLKELHISVIDSFILLPTPIGVNWQHHVYLETARC